MPDIETGDGCPHPVPPRKIGYHHMAFYRGWLQGLPLRQMADAYLETGLDLRQARSTLRWIQDTLRQAAHRHGHHGEARLLRLRIQDVRQRATPTSATPDIDAFREEVDPDSFYSYDALLRRYLDRYPEAAGDRRAKRRAALIERQLRALTWIEDLLTTAPVAADPVQAWFDPGLSERLTGAGIASIGDLMTRIRDHGYHWYRHLPGIGATKARRLLKWLDTYQASLGALPAYARIAPARQTPSITTRPPQRLLAAEDAPAGGDAQAPAIVPFEAMLLPRAELPESAMASLRTQIPARNDKEAIQAWLDAKTGSLATARAYRKEAERFLLWTVVERGKVFRTLDVADCTAYRDWLGTLGRVDAAAWPFRIAQEQWFAPRYTRRYSPAWRPFSGPLSPRSARYALTVCAALFAWLNKVGYLPFDAWEAVSKPHAGDGPAPDIELTRALSARQWQAVLDAVAALPDADRCRDATLLLRLALVTGMRRAELAQARMGHVYAHAARTGGTRWMLKVHGKGGRWRAAPLTADVLELLRQQLRHFGLADDPRTAPPETPLIATEDGAPLTASGIAQRFHALFARAAEQAGKDGHAQDAHTLARASAHWVRHTTGSMLADHGVPPSQIQKLLGHVSLATTSIYTDTGLDRIFESVNAVLGRARDTGARE